MLTTDLLWFLLSWLCFKKKNTTETFLYLPMLCVYAPQDTCTATDMQPNHIVSSVV